MLPMRHPPLACRGEGAWDRGGRCEGGGRDGACTGAPAAVHRAMPLLARARLLGGALQERAKESAEEGGEDQASQCGEVRRDGRAGTGGEGLERTREGLGGEMARLSE